MRLRLGLRPFRVYAALGGALVLIATVACGGDTEVIERIVVETVIVEQTVRETVIVERAVEVIVKETVVVQQQLNLGDIVATAEAYGAGAGSKVEATPICPAPAPETQSGTLLVSCRVVQVFDGARIANFLGNKKGPP